MRETLEQCRPDILLIHAYGAQLSGSGLILMEHEQIVKVCQVAPQAQVVATHMESLNHATVTRDQLAAFAADQGVPSSQLFIPRDGETLEFEK